MWASRFFEDLLQDFRYAVRYLRKTPGFTAVAVLSLAVGIGANTAIFTIINAVLLKSLPVRDPGNLVVLGDTHASGSGSGIPRNGSFTLFSHDLYKNLEGTGVFAGVCAVQSSTVGDITIRRAGWSEPQLAQAKLVSGNYFDVLGVRAVLGRVIAPLDDAPSAVPVAVVSFRYWKDKFGGDPSAISSTIYLGGVSFTIIGVAPPEFYGETLQPDPPGFWLPISADRPLNHGYALVDDPDEHWLYLIGRLAPGVSDTQAQIRLTATLRNWLVARAGADLSAERRSRISGSHVEVRPGASGIIHMQQAYSGTLRLLLGISIAVLLITCANIASLLLARGAARTSETSVRIALGASRWRLARQSLTESLGLALAGGALGLLAASGGTGLLIALFFHGTEYVPIPNSPDLRVLAFTFTLSCGAAMVFGLMPAVRMSSRATPEMRGASPGIKGSRIGAGGALIVGEVALSLVVLSVAGSFARSLANLGNQQFGFDQDRVLILNIDPRNSGYEDNRLAALYRRMYSRLNSLPGIRSAAFSYYSPFNRCCWAFSSGILGYTPKLGESMSVRLNRVSPGYFRTIGTKVLRGRTFDERDGPASRRVAVVSEEFVRRFLTRQDPIGSRFGIGGPADAGDLEIVGVVADAKYESPREDPTPMAFLPFLQVKAGESAAADESNLAAVVEVRSAVPQVVIASEVRHALAEIDPGLPVVRVSSLADQVSLMLNQENVIAALALFFGFVALVLSCLWAAWFDGLRGSAENQ